MALARVLGPVRATGLGAGSMLGAGVFVALGPAVARTGTFVVWAVLLAALVAGLNATASARLAVRHPRAGGTYVFARERLGPTWGHLAGWVFVVGKTASCAAMALAVGAHLSPDHATALAVATVVVLTLVDLAGARRSADAVTASAVLVVLVVGGSTLALLAREPAAPSDAGYAIEAIAIPQAAALLFFAFAGYARLATLGEEVRDPVRTIPRAVAIAFAVVTLLYLGAGVVVARALTLEEAGASDRALADAVDTLGHPALTAAVAGTAVVAAGGALLSLLGGVSRTTLAMARDQHLPSVLAAESRRGVPWAAQVAVGCAVVLALPFVDAVDAVAASSGCVLIYYALTNAAAFPLGGKLLRPLSVLGLLGCVALVASLPLAGVLWTVGVVALGLVVGRWTARRSSVV